MVVSHLAPHKKAEPKKTKPGYEEYRKYFEEKKVYYIKLY